jgi:hypothetical protein
MPWTCPACGVAIRHNEIDPAPRAGVVYRWPICRLELAVDPTTNKLTVAPIENAKDKREVQPLRNTTPPSPKANEPPKADRRNGKDRRATTRADRRQSPKRR